MHKRMLFIALLLLSSANSYLLSQNESGSRFLDIGGCRIRGVYYDSSVAAFQESFPIIRTVPPLNSGMPFLSMMTYVLCDSLLRFSTDKQHDSVIQHWSTINDTLKWSAALLYSIKDYNPIIWNQYQTTVDILRILDTNKMIRISVGDSTLPIRLNPQARYISSLKNIEYELERKVGMLVDTSISHSYYSLLHCDYIMRVKVLRIDSMLDKYPTNWHEMLYQVTAQVLDTLKGKVYKYIPCNEQSVDKSKHVQAQDCPVIRFLYVKSQYSDVGTFGNDTRLVDSAMTDSNGGLQLQTGRDYVVFLNYVNTKIDTCYDYYDLYLNQNTSMGAIRIDDNNMVHDLNKYWIDHIDTYSTYKTVFLSRKANIVNRNY